MRHFVQISLLAALSGLAAIPLAAAGPVPYIRTVLAFDDGTFEICQASAFTLDFLRIDLAVTRCDGDRVFGDGFGG